MQKYLSLPLLKLTRAHQLPTLRSESRKFSWKLYGIKTADNYNGRRIEIECTGNKTVMIGDRFTILTRYQRVTNRYRSDGHTDGISVIVSRSAMVRETA